MNSASARNTGGLTLETTSDAEGRRYALKQKVSKIISDAIANKGNLGIKYNQIPLSKFSPRVIDMVYSASGGRIDLSKKVVALHGARLWHEFQKHNDAALERGKHQIAMTTSDMEAAIMAIYSPDFVEAIFSEKENPTQAQSFAYAKQTSDGHYVVVEVVGGNRNPSVVPAMIVKFDSHKWNNMIASGLTLGELVHENSTDLKNALDIRFNKKNQVTAAQFASKKAIANTPRSPRSINSIANATPKSNPTTKISSKNLRGAVRPCPTVSPPRLRR